MCAQGCLQASIRGTGPIPTHLLPLKHTLLRVEVKGSGGSRDHLLSGFRSHSGCFQDGSWQEPSGWSPKNAPALPHKQSHGGGGAAKPAPASEEHHAGCGPLPGVPEGTGCLGPGTLRSVLQDPGGLWGLLLLAFFFFLKRFLFFKVLVSWLNVKCKAAYKDFYFDVSWQYLICGEGTF